MIIFFVILLIMFSSTAVIREKRAGAGRARALQLEPVPHVLVQQARTESVRHFLGGKASLLNLQENGTLMIVENQQNRTSDKNCYLLKSKDPYHFQSTMVSQDPKGRISVHASLRDGRKPIVFRAES